MPLTYHVSLAAVEGVTVNVVLAPGVIAAPFGVMANCVVVPSTLTVADAELGALWASPE